MDRTKALYGPRTQAYGETNYLKEKLHVLDKTKALYGPRTQAYGETNYLREKLQVLDTTRDSIPWRGYVLDRMGFPVYPRIFKSKETSVNKCLGPV